MDSLLILYLILGTLHICFRNEGQRFLGSLSKVLLMPTLIFYVLSHTPEYSLIVTALIFATLGDFLLAMIAKRTCFIIGMASFAISHLLYMAHLTLFAPLRLSLILFSILLLGIPFILIQRKVRMPSNYALYATNLLLLTAFCIGTLNLLCLLGALAFIISDSMIALDSLKRRHFHTASVMSSYLLAQLLLILGFLSL